MCIFIAIQIHDEVRHRARAPKFQRDIEGPWFFHVPYVSRMGPTSRGSRWRLLLAIVSTISTHTVTQPENRFPFVHVVRRYLLKLFPRKLDRGNSFNVWSSVFFHRPYNYYLGATNIMRTYSLTADIFASRRQNIQSKVLSLIFLKFTKI